MRWPKTHHFEVALRWHENKPVPLDMMAKAKALDVCPGSWVQGEDQRQLRCNFVQDFQQGCKCLRLVHVRRAMQRYDPVAFQAGYQLGRKTLCLQRVRRFARKLPVLQQ